jgi:hypothetical protein
MPAVNSCSKHQNGEEFILIVLCFVKRSSFSFFVGILATVNLVELTYTLKVITDTKQTADAT